MSWEPERGSRLELDMCLLGTLYRRPTIVATNVRRAAVLAATTEQDGPVLCPLRCPDTVAIGWEFAVDAWVRPNTS